jgi:hypothetical protein
MESEIKEREIPGAQDGDASHAAHNKIYTPQQQGLEITQRGTHFLFFAI